MAAATEVFVGRDQEIDALCAALDSVCAGNGRVALIAGEPGIGKTRYRTRIDQPCRTA